MRLRKFKFICIWSFLSTGLAGFAASIWEETSVVKTLDGILAMRQEALCRQKLACDVVRGEVPIKRSDLMDAKRFLAATIAGAATMFFPGFAIYGNMADVAVMKTLP